MNGKLFASLDLQAFLPLDEIRIPPVSASLHYAHAIFEGMSMVKVDGALSLFHPWLNLERMRLASGIVGIGMEGFGDREIIANAFAIAALSGFDKGGDGAPELRRAGKAVNKYYVRPLLFVESEEFGLSSKMTPRLLLSVFPMGDYLDYDKKRGIDALLSPSARSSAFASVKASSNYQLGVVARSRMERFNRDNGVRCQETIFPDGAGKLVEGCVENIAVIRGRELITPHPSKGALPGVTMRMARWIAEENGLAFRFGSFSLRELAQSDCIFMTGNAVGVVPIASMAEVDAEHRLKRWHHFESAENEHFVAISEEYEGMEIAQGRHRELHEPMDAWLGREERLRLNSAGEEYLERRAGTGNGGGGPGGTGIRMAVTPATGRRDGSATLQRFGLERAYGDGGGAL